MLLKDFVSVLDDRQGCVVVYVESPSGRLVDAQTNAKYLKENKHEFGDCEILTVHVSKSDHLLHILLK